MNTHTSSNSPFLPPLPSTSTTPGSNVVVKGTTSQPFISSAACIRTERLYRVICRRLGHRDVDHAIARDLRTNGALVVDLDLANRDILYSIVGLLKEAPTIYQLLLYSGTYFFGHQPAYKDQVRSRRRRLKYTILTETDLVRQLVQSLSTYLQSTKLVNNVLVIDLTGVPLKPVSSSSSRASNTTNAALGLSGVLRTAVWKSSGPLEDLIQGLKCCRRLQKLSLANCQLTDTGLQLLAPIVGKELPRLTSLCLAKNRLMRPARALRTIFNMRSVLVGNKKSIPLSSLDLGRNPLGCGVSPDFNRLEAALVVCCGLGSGETIQAGGLQTLALNGCRLERIDGIIKTLQETIQRGEEKENGAPYYSLPRIRDINISNNPSLAEGTQSTLNTLLSSLAQLRGDLVYDDHPIEEFTESIHNHTTRFGKNTTSWRRTRSLSSIDDDNDHHDDATLEALQEYFPVVRDAISDGDSYDGDRGEEATPSGVHARDLKSDLITHLHTITQLIDTKYPPRRQAGPTVIAKVNAAPHSGMLIPYDPSTRGMQDIMNASCVEGSSHIGQGVTTNDTLSSSSSADVVVMVGDEEEEESIPIIS